MPRPTVVGVAAARSQVHMPYVPALDGIRALAALAVLAFHVRLAGFSGGFIGVDVFFVLSGYLVTRMLLVEWRARGEVALFAFFLRRVGRLVPALLVFLCAIVLLYSTLGLGSESGLDLAAEILPTLAYVSNFTIWSQGEPDLLQHSWSLSIEMQFYVIWPVLVLLLARLKALWACGLLAAITLPLWVWRIDAYALLDWRYAYYASEVQITALLFGALVAFLPESAVARAGSGMVAALAAATLVCLVSALTFYTLASAVAGPVVEIASAALVLAATRGGGGIGRMLASMPVVWVGRLSYSLYLWHYPLARAVRLEFGGLASFALVLPAALLLAWISYRWVETPARRAVARRLSPARVAT